MKFGGNGAQAVVFFAACAMALPVFGKTADPRSTPSTRKTSEVGSSTRQSQRNGVPSEVAISGTVKPNFYREISQQKLQSSRPRASSVRTSAESSKRNTPVSTVAGPHSVRRLQPDSTLFTTVSHSPVDTKILNAATMPDPRAEQGGTVHGVTDLPVANKEGKWARLNPLKLFESRKPRLVPTGYVQTGIASWYGSDFHGGPTASGERYDMHSLTAAHPSLPFGTLVRVTNLRNGREVVVRVNNRGPYRRNRIIDLSKEAARQLGMVGAGLAKVQVEVLQAVEPIGQWGQQALQKLSAR